MGIRPCPASLQALAGGCGFHLSVELKVFVAVHLVLCSARPAVLGPASAVSSQGSAPCRLQAQGVCWAASWAPESKLLSHWEPVPHPLPSRCPLGLLPCPCPGPSHRGGGVLSAVPSILSVSPLFCLSVQQAR